MAKQVCGDLQVCLVLSFSLKSGFLFFFRQENGLKKWLNFVLTPMDELNQEGSSSVPGKVDVVKLWKECSKNVRVPR